MKISFTFVFVLLSIAARSGDAQTLTPAFAVALFNDSQSTAIVVSRDVSGVPTFFLDVVVFLRSTPTSLETIVDMFSFPHGDIASSGSLNAKGRLLEVEIPSVICSSSPCTASFQTAFPNWCNYIGRAFTIETRVDGVTTTMMAVLGLGSLSSSTSCPFASSFSTQPSPAIVQLQAVGPSGVTGAIVLQLRDNALSVSGFVYGLAPLTTFGVHVHQYGDLRDTQAAMATGGHFMFSDQLHGLLTSGNRHSGDLGNIVSDKHGGSAFNILVPTDMVPERALTLLAANGRAVGRAIIIHATTDDGVTQPTGASGARRAQGVVGFASTVSSSGVMALFFRWFTCRCTLTDPTTKVAYNAFCPTAQCATDAEVSPGVIVAAVLGPIAFIAIMVAVYFKFCRKGVSSSKAAANFGSSGKRADNGAVSSSSTEVLVQAKIEDDLL